MCEVATLHGSSVTDDASPRASPLPTPRTIASVAYDEDLANRIRELLGDESELTEKKMFGGLAFLVGGNMAVAASGQGGLLVRVDPAQSDVLVATTSARPMEMRGRSMQGWLRVDSDDVGTDSELAKWVELGATYCPLSPREAIGRAANARRESWRASNPAAARQTRGRRGSTFAEPRASTCMSSSSNEVDREFVAKQTQHGNNAPSPPSYQSSDAGRR